MFIFQRTITQGELFWQTLVNSVFFLLVPASTIFPFITSLLVLLVLLLLEEQATQADSNFIVPSRSVWLNFVLVCFSPDLSFSQSWLCLLVC